MFRVLLVLQQTSMGIYGCHVTEKASSYGTQYPQAHPFILLITLLI